MIQDEQANANETPQFHELKEAFKGLYIVDNYASCTNKYKSLSKLSEEQRYFFHALLQSLLEKRMDECCIEVETKISNVYDGPNVTCMTADAFKHLLEQWKKDSPIENPVTKKQIQKETLYYMRLRCNIGNQHSYEYEAAYKKAKGDVAEAINIISEMQGLDDGVRKDFIKLLVLECLYELSGDYKTEIKQDSLAKNLLAMIKTNVENGLLVHPDMIYNGLRVLVSNCSEAEVNLKRAVEGILNSDEFKKEYKEVSDIMTESAIERFLKWICKVLIAAYKYVETMFRFKAYDIQDEINIQTGKMNKRVYRLMHDEKAVDQKKSGFSEYVKNQLQQYEEQSIA